MVVCDEVQLSPRSGSFDICCYKPCRMKESDEWRKNGGTQTDPELQSLHLPTQDVVMSHQESLIYFSLSEPTLFFCGEENFNSHSLAPPLAHPDLPVSPFSNLFHHLDLLGDGPLHLETEFLYQLSSQSHPYTAIRKHLVRND